MIVELARGTISGVVPNQSPFSFIGRNDQPSFFSWRRSLDASASSQSRKVTIFGRDAVIEFAASRARRVFIAHTKQSTIEVAFQCYSYRRSANAAQMEINMRRFCFVLVFLLAAAAAFAHDNKGPNGGRVKDLGPFHAELTAKGNTVELYVTDTANKAIAMDGYKGLAVLAVGGKSERIDLDPLLGTN